MCLLDFRPTFTELCGWLEELYLHLTLNIKHKSQDEIPSPNIKIPVPTLDIISEQSTQDNTLDHSTDSTTNQRKDSTDSANQTDSGYAHDHSIDSTFTIDRSMDSALTDSMSDGQGPEHCTELANQSLDISNNSCL